MFDEHKEWGHTIGFRLGTCEEEENRLIYEKFCSNTNEIESFQFCPVCGAYLGLSART